MKPTKSFEEPENIRKTEKKMLRFGSNELESKYVGEVSPLLKQAEP